MFTRLLESSERSNSNRTPEKVQLGLPGNPVAFACKLLFAKGYGSYVFFDSTTKLLTRYRKTLSAPSRFGRVRAINLKAAEKRLN